MIKLVHFIGGRNYEFYNFTLFINMLICHYSIT